MLRSDYIVRLIEHFGRALRRIILLKEAQRLDAAQDTVDETAQEFFGLNLSLLDAVDTDSVVQLLAHPDKLQLLARLLVVEADLCLATGELDRAARAYLRVLELHAAALKAGGALGDAQRDEVALALKQVGADAVPAGLKNSLRDALMNADSR
ncbi:MAG: hypothetical protein ABIJ09_25035 [Pseudomonadota bacterium]